MITNPGRDGSPERKGELPVKIGFWDVVDIILKLMGVVSFFLSVLAIRWAVNGCPRIYRLRRMERTAARRVWQDSGVRLRRKERFTDSELLEIFEQGKPPDAVWTALSARAAPARYKAYLFQAWKTGEQICQEDILGRCRKAAAFFPPLVLTGIFLYNRPYHIHEEDHP